MSICFAYGCSHRALHESCRFFRFPKDKRQFNIWRNLCRRSDSEPKEFSRLCSCHFVDGKKENGPTIFVRNTSSFFRYTSPEKRKRRKKKTGTSEAQERPLVEQPTTSGADHGGNGSALGASAEPTSIDISVYEKKIAELESCNSRLRGEILVLQSELEIERLKPFHCKPGNVLSYKALKLDPELFRYYTGLPDPNVFDMLLKWLKKFKYKYVDNWVVLKLSLEDQLLLTFVKLRLNSDYTDLAVRFQVSRVTVRNVCITLIHVLHSILFPTIKMPSTKKNQHCMSSAFSKFSNCRCIIDCTEIQCAVPRSSFDNQSKTFSHYKNRNTFKGLVACSPHGAITFLSKLYPGSASDKAIFKDSEIVKEFVSGDLIIADKGFLIADLLPNGVTLNIPPFLKHGQLTEAEAKVTTEIARARIHIERVIGRMKNYNILDFVPVHLRMYSTKIFQLVGSLVNLHHPLVHDVGASGDSDSDFWEE